MTEIERLTVLIGELIATEIDEVNEINYSKEDITAAFTVIMKSGKRYNLTIQELS